ncbi:MAG: hypothetical protein GQ570_10045 [Helicobacteraceae bacterium]|nr:hypothetical protein [Helicobacteraceae bacterium]
MIARLRNTLLYLLLFIAMLIVFMPKVNLYYLLEKELSAKGVVISSENLSDRFFSLNIKDATIYVKQIKSAKVANVNITTLLFYNYIEFDNIELSQSFEDMLPTKIKNVKILYSVLNPLNITATSIGEFGEASAVISLEKRVVFVTIKASKRLVDKYSKILRPLKTDGKGSYTYEYNF